MIRLVKIFFLCLFTLGIASAQLPTNGLQGYWPFHGNAGDSSSHANHGVVHGAILVNDRFGNCNQAYKFNGTSNNIIVPNSPTVDFNNTTDFSISYWIKIGLANNDGIPLSKNQYGSFSGYQFFTSSNNPGYCNTPLHASFYVSAGAGQDACSNNAIDTNWHFFTGIYKYAVNQALFYVDAVLQADIGQSSGGISTTADLYFGSNTAGSNLFTGSLDAIRIYNRALTTSEVTQLFNEPNPGSGGNMSSNILRDTTVCSATSITLQASGATSYTWSTGSHASSIQVSANGTYWVNVSGAGCASSDTSHVKFVVPQSYNYLKDTSVCSQQLSFTLDETPAHGDSYAWNDGTNGAVKTIHGSGTYWVDIKVGSCTVRDSATVTIKPSPILGLPADTFICSAPVQLTVKDTGISVTWWNGSHAHQVMVDQAGTYTVTGSKNGCTTTSDIVVSTVNAVPMNVPNVFTPNGDGKNDVFELSAQNLDVKEFSIYNRWGTMVYHAINTNVKWDGKQKDGLVNDGTYFWTAIFDHACNASQEEVKQTGFITIFK